MKSGELLGRYRLFERLGKGGMGEVWAAESVETAARVVIKCILSAGLAPEQATALRDRLLREARIMEELRHEAIVAGLEHFVHEGEVYLVLEYVAGRTVSEWLAATPPPPLADRLDVLIQVGGALAHAHAAGVIHRDLKPDNILVTAELKAKVFDFGLARALDSTQLTRTGMIMGTLCYMAPEQALGKKDVDHRADLYAFGMVIALSLGLREPFRESSSSAMYRRLISAEPIEVDDWAPEDLKQFIAGLLAKDPGKRTASAAEVVAFLEALRSEAGALEARLAAAATAGARRSPPRLGTIERGDCLAVLDELRGRLASGKRESLLILAPLGGGRTTALEQCLERLRAAGMNVARLTFNDDEALGLSLWACLASLTASVTDTLAPGQKEAEATQDLFPNAKSLQRDILATVRKHCAEGALALAVDDLQYASAGELQFIEQLLDLTQDMPLLLLLAGDAAAEGAGAARAEAYGAFLARLAASDRCRRFVLEPLAAASVLSDLASRGVPDEIARQVHSYAGGSPGLVQSLLQDWHRGGTLSRVMAGGPPASVNELRQRLALVGDPALAVLRALVEMGGEGELDGVVKATGMPRLAVQARLRDLGKKHGWVRLEGNRVELTQPQLGAALRPPNSDDTMGFAPGQGPA